MVFLVLCVFFFFQAEDGIRDRDVTGVQTCALPISMPDVMPFARINASDAALVGGKGLSLALTARAGLPVPPGFCVTTAAYRRVASDPRVDPPLADALAVAYRELGGGFVAV